MVAVGFTLQPELEFLERTAALCENDVDYFEVAPETLWRVDGEGRLLPNGFHRRFAALREATRRPFVAHGVGLSLSSNAPADGARRRAWLARIREDHRVFAFEWYTDHLGATAADGAALALPLPMPMDAWTAGVVRRNLRALRGVVPDVGVENTANYFTLGDPLDEPSWLHQVVAMPRTWLLLDLHNVWTMAENAGFDPDAWLERAPLERVIEIHVAGGKYSDPRWLPSGRSMRLDGHDSAVPDEVFAMLERVLPRCPHVRGVTLERMEGTVGPGDTLLLRDELKRIRQIVRRAAKKAPVTRRGIRSKSRVPSGPQSRRALVADVRSGGSSRAERWIARAMTATDPVACLELAARDPALSAPLRRAFKAADPDGVRLSALLVARLRFERLVQGSNEASAWFEQGPRSFAAAFRDYHTQVTPLGFFPAQEASSFSEWLESGLAARSRQLRRG